MNYLLIISNNDKQTPLAFCWYDEFSRNYDINIFNNISSYEEVNQINEWAKTKLLPYTHKVLEPWTKEFWDEVAVVIKNKSINILNLYK